MIFEFNSTEIINNIQGISSGGIFLAVVSILVSIFVALTNLYYKRKSIYEKKFQDAQKKHSTDLKNFLEYWIDNLPMHRSSYYYYLQEWMKDRICLSVSPLNSLWPFWPVTKSNADYTIELLESDWRYNDFITFHLPKEERQLLEIWKDYKELELDQRSLFYDIFNKINSDVIEEINQLGITYDTELDPFPPKSCWILLSNFIKALYLQYHFLYLEKDDEKLKGKTAFNEYFIHVMPHSMIRGFSLDQTSKRVNTDYDHNAYMLKVMELEIAEGTKGEIEQLKEIFEKMAFDNSYLSRYKKEIMRLFEIERKLNIISQDIIKLNEKLIAYPQLPGVKCNMLSTVK